MKTRRRMNLVSRWVAPAVGLALFATAATAQVPDRMNYQGVLKKGDGTSVGEGYKDIEFRIYDAATGGNLIWARTQRAHTDADGLFNIVLMDGGTPIPGAQTESLATVFTGSGGENRLLELTVSGSTPIMPRQRFVTAPYAFMAGNVANAGANFTVQGALSVVQGAQVKTLTVTENATVGGDLAVQQGAQVKTLAVTESATVGGDATIGGALVANGGQVHANGRIYNNSPYAQEDVWIQGNPVDGAPPGKTRNLALVGFEDSDHLYLNWDSEYTNGTTIGGPVYVAGNLQVQGDTLIMGPAQHAFNAMPVLSNGQSSSETAPCDGFLIVVCQNGSCRVHVNDQDIGYLNGRTASQVSTIPIRKSEVWKIDSVDNGSGGGVFYNWRPLSRP